MSKKRFVNEELLVQNLPIFPCGITEENIDALIDFVEEELILKKAKEIQARRKNVEKVGNQSSSE